MRVNHLPKAGETFQIEHFSCVHLIPEQYVPRVAAVCIFVFFVVSFDGVNFFLKGLG